LAQTRVFDVRFHGRAFSDVRFHRVQGEFQMTNSLNWSRIVAVGALMSACGAAWAQTSVTYGRITAVNLITEANRQAQTAGAILGGALGASSASNRSSSTRVLRGVAGGVAGQQVGRVTTQRQTFEYTVLLGGTSSIRIVTDEVGMRVGDCVAVERGAFNNLRLVDDARCAPPRAATPAKKAAPAPQATAEDVRVADACIAAKNLMLDADTDEAFDRAERRVRLLCAD
jgi:outer membrane lipoprotein SlyB